MGMLPDLHICESEDCRIHHRENGIFAYRRVDDPSTVTRFELPVRTPERIEAERKFMAAWWQVPVEAVEVIEDGCTIDGEPWPMYQVRRGGTTDGPAPG